MEQDRVGKFDKKSKYLTNLALGYISQIKALWLDSVDASGSNMYF